MLKVKEDVPTEVESENAPSGHVSLLGLNEEADEFFDVLEEDEFTYYDRLDYEWSPEPSSLNKPQPKLTSATSFVRKFQGFATQKKGCMEYQEVAREGSRVFSYGTSLQKDPTCTSPCSWSAGDPSLFLIRGKTYLKDHGKIKANRTVMQMVGADWLISDKREDDLGSRVGGIVEIPGSPTYTLALYYMIKSPIEDHPLLYKFVNGDDAFRNSRFKLIPYISETSRLMLVLCTDLSYDNLSGLIPQELMQLQNLFSLRLENNSLSRDVISLSNCISLTILRRSPTNMIPLLLIPSKKSSTKGKLYSLQSKSKVSEIELPKLHTWRFCGSCYGWLATVDQGGIITLSNPFRKACSINLPRIDTKIFGILEYQFTVPKVVLSEDPLLYPDNYVVTIIYVPYYKLAVYRSGQKDWIYINRDDLKEWGFTDIISHKNFVYAIRPMNILLSFDVNGFGYDGTSKSPKWNTLLGDEDNDEPDWSNQIYLVKSSMGNLYSIHRYLDIDAHSTKRFDVFKLIFDEENGNLLGKKEVHHIDGDIVFVGDNDRL
ncbi:hypothetical protein GQ457_12G019560 [Hibiscus cannabinus]